MARMRSALVLLAAPLFAADCASLARLALPATTIDSAVPVTGGTFQPPGGAPLRNLPPFCRVAGVIRPTADSEIRFETWLPLDKWNGRFQGVGNGGYAGSIGHGGLAGALQAGYASGSTDTGHSGGGDPKWALNHPEKIIDFGWRGIHEMTVKSKALVEAFYGRKPERSYFNSCSNGGRQALMEAQRFPEDYDGIIAGAPANYWTHLMTLGMNQVRSTLQKKESYIPAAKLKAIQANVLAACDARDQVTDGVIEEPLSCKPDFDKLLCSGAENDSCLTAPQLEALKAISRGPHDRRGKRIFPPVSPGGEAEPGGWAGWITGAQPEAAAMFFFAVNFYRYFIYSDPAWDWRTWDIERDTKLADEKMGAALNAVDPDLSKFAARGGKLILYHGWCDAAIPAENSIDYFRSVEKKLGARKTQSFVRLFLAPGVQHCGGGAGPNSFGQGGPKAGASPDAHVDAALVRWVEQGTAPERIVAAKMKGPAVERTRPLCAFPLVARYKGAGSTDDAANFDCAKPAKR